MKNKTRLEGIQLKTHKWGQDLIVSVRYGKRNNEVREVGMRFQKRRRYNAAAVAARLRWIAQKIETT